MSQYILGIDQGTTGTKVYVFGERGEIVRKAYRELTQYYPQPGWVEHDPEEIWRTTWELVQEVLDEAVAHALAGVAITNQRETTILWDKQTGKAVGNAVVWQCRRSTAICEELRERGWEPVIREKTGLLIDPYFSGTKVRWMVEECGEVRELMAQNRLAFGTVDSWLIWKLTGHKVHATDYSNAARTLLFNCRTLEWDEELLGLMKVSRDAMPMVLNSADFYGETVENGRLPAGVPITSVIGDSQGALFGEACFRKGMAKATYGTGTSLMVNVGSEWITPASGLVTTIAWGIDGAITYACEGLIHVTGGVITWLRDGLGIIAEPHETEHLARTLRDNEGVYIVPAFVGLGIPYWDAEARGLIKGLTRGTNRAHLCRAALESIAYQVRDALEAVKASLPFPLVEIKADGGASANALLMQFQADILGIPVSCPSVKELSLLGAVYLSGLRAGFWYGLDDISASWEEAVRYEPQMPSADVERLYAGWKDAVSRCFSGRTS